MTTKTVRHQKWSRIAFLAPFFFGCLCLSTPSFAERGCPNLLKKMVEGNRFTVDRSMWDYATEFHPDFITDLKALKSSDVILDGGAGDASALQEYLYADAIVDPYFTRSSKIDLPPKKDRAYGIAIAYKKPEGTVLNTKRLNYIEGDIADLLGKHPELANTVSMIVDEYGVMKYYFLDKTLDIYFKLLKKGGKIYFRFPDAIISKNRKRVSFVSYLSSIKGASFKFIPSPNYTTPEAAEMAGKFVLEKVEDEVVVSPLTRKSVNILEDVGPESTYSWP